MTRTTIHTPWGWSQDVEELAEGVLRVSTAGHGGLKLSLGRWASLPRAVRDAMFNATFAEEDCEEPIVRTLLGIGGKRDREMALDIAGRFGAVRSSAPLSPRPCAGAAPALLEGRGKPMRRYVAQHVLPDPILDLVPEASSKGYNSGFNAGKTAALAAMKELRKSEGHTSGDPHPPPASPSPPSDTTPSPTPSTSPAKPAGSHTGGGIARSVKFTRMRR